MRRLHSCSLFCAALLFALAPSVSMAQADAEPPAEEGSALSQVESEVAVPDPNDGAPWEINLEALEITLMPLTLEELEAVADQWIVHLHQICDEIAGVRLRVNEAKQREDEAAGDAARKELVTLRSRRSAIIDRVDTVLDELEAKGGEAEESRAYVSSVSGSGVEEIADASTLVETVKQWIESPDGGIKWALRLGSFIAILVGFMIVGAIVAGIMRRALGRFKKTSSLLRDFLVGITRKTIVFIGLVVGLAALGVPMGPFFAAIGAAGLVIGLALQGTLSNFASGIMILLYRPFDVGHFVNVGGASGTVKSMTLVSTTLTTPDNQLVIVPNNSVWGSVITNVTGNATRRVDMVFGIGYGDDIEKARGVLEKVLGAHELVLKDPAWNIQVSALADSSVNFICRPWVKTSDYWTVFFDVTTEVKKQFDANDISIPFPQRDVHIYREDAE